MTKLFALRITSTGALMGEFFSSKERAKQRRDELNGCKPTDEGAVVRYVVTYGPDHHKFSKE